MSDVYVYLSHATLSGVVGLSERLSCLRRALLEIGLGGLAADRPLGRCIVACECVAALDGRDWCARRELRLPLILSLDVCRLLLALVRCPHDTLKAVPAEEEDCLRECQT